MSKFKDNSAKELPPVTTSSLPDIVFMILIFFMVSVKMREMTPLVKTKLPEATEITKLEKKTLVSHILIGKPTAQYISVYGSEPRIQLNDKFASVDEIISFIESERSTRSEVDRPFMITALKVDEDTKMQLVSAVKQELRKAAALHLSYSTRKGTKD